MTQNHRADAFVLSRVSGKEILFWGRLNFPSARDKLLLWGQQRWLYKRNSAPMISAQLGFYCKSLSSGIVSVTFVVVTKSEAS